MGKTQEGAGVWGSLKKKSPRIVTESKSIVKQSFYIRSAFSPCVCQVCKKNDSFI